MFIIDTHSHIFDEKFDIDIDQVISRAKENNIKHILLPNIDTSTIDRLHNLCEKYPTCALPMMGLHPTSVRRDWQIQLDQTYEEFTKRKYVGVGEIGIDLYWDKSLLNEQQQVFEEQLKWSIEYGLPVSIHSRNATMEVIDCIKRVGKEKLKGVFHSFCGSSEDLVEILALNNFYIGINGAVTYKKSTLPEVISKTDLSHIVVETDAPYLPPVPYRGKRNEPSYIRHVVSKLSEIYETDFEKVANITTMNAKNVFNII